MVSGTVVMAVTANHDQPSLPRGLVLCVTGWVEDFEEFRVQVVGVGYPGVQ